MHIIAQRSKDGTEPIIPDMMLPRGFLVWDENRPRRDSERGYPTKHWLIGTGSFSPIEVSNKQQLAADLNMFNSFARLSSEAGQTVATMNDGFLPISKAKLWARDPREYWLLLLHHIYPPQRNMWFPPEGAAQTSRPAQEGEPYIAILEDVFLKSAFACGDLSARVQAGLTISQKEKEVKMINQQRLDTAKFIDAF